MSKEPGFRKYGETAKFLWRLMRDDAGSDAEMRQELHRFRVMWGRSETTAAAAGFCGAELLPHATYPDGSPAPIICTQAPHDPGTFHSNEELGTRWKGTGQ